MWGALGPAGTGRLAGLGLVAMVALGACASQKGALNEDTFDARKKLTRELMNRGDWGPAFAYADALP